MDPNYHIFHLAVLLFAYGPGDDSVIAFTPFGIENLQELIEMDRDRER